MKITIEEIREFLSRVERTTISDGTLTRAAVLVPFFERQGELFLLLTKRTDEVEHHKGQVSFPGGACDVDDADIVDTALREAEEEIGLPRAAVEVVGLFNDIRTPTGFVITPVVGFIPRLPALRISRNEVAEILEVPVSLFLDSSNARIERRSLGGKSIEVYFYTFENSEIWGATAWIIRSMLAAIRKA